MMKKWAKIGGLIVLFLLPTLLLALSACGHNADNEFRPEDNAAEFTIRHFDLDVGNENVEFFYEIPHMEGITPEAKRFNAFFDALYEEFMTTEPKKVRELLDAAAPGRPSTDDPYRYCWRAEVHEVSEQWVSVTMSYDWYMGGVWDYGIDGYTFDCETGKRLFLDDVLPGTEEMIQAAIADGLKEQYPEIAELADGQGNTPLTALDKIPVRDIDFYIAEGGSITVVFDKYEIAPGVAGMFLVVLDGCDTLDTAYILPFWRKITPATVYSGAATGRNASASKDTTNPPCRAMILVLLRCYVFLRLQSQLFCLYYHSSFERALSPNHRV